VPDFLLDSCVLIRHLRRHEPTTQLLASLVAEGSLGIATITRTEILEGMREHERPATIRLLDSLVSYPLDAPTADQAGDYIRSYRSQGITMHKPDAIIAATAVCQNLTLVTYNPSHFSMTGLRRYEPMP